jgi:hypothetical protein
MSFQHPSRHNRGFSHELEGLQRDGSTRLMAACSILLSMFGATKEAHGQEYRSAEDARGPPTVWVHLHAPSNVELQREQSSKEWVTVCQAPCNGAVPKDGFYRVAGGTSPSSRFMLEAPAGGRAEIFVDMPSTPTRVAGWVAFGLGGATAVLGLVVLAGSCTPGAHGESDCESEGPFSPAAGGAAILVGSLVMLTGLMLALTNRKSDVS